MQTAEGRGTQARMRTEEREIEAREKEEKRNLAKGLLDGTNVQIYTKVKYIELA